MWLLCVLRARVLWGDDRSLVIVGLDIAAVLAMCGCRVLYRHWSNYLMFCRLRGGLSLMVTQCRPNAAPILSGGIGTLEELILE